MGREWLTMDDESPATWEDWADEAEAQRHRAEVAERRVAALVALCRKAGLDYTATGEATP